MTTEKLARGMLEALVNGFRTAAANARDGGTRKQHYLSMIADAPSANFGVSLVSRALMESSGDDAGANADLQRKEYLRLEALYGESLTANQFRHELNKIYVGPFDSDGGTQ